MTEPIQPVPAPGSTPPAWTPAPAEDATQTAYTTPAPVGPWVSASPAPAEPQPAPPTYAPPAYAQPVYAQPTYAQPEAWIPPVAPPAGQPAGWVATPPPASSRSTNRSRGGIGPATLLAAMVGTAVLASGGTYLAIGAANNGGAVSPVANVPAGQGTQATTPPQGSTATQAPAATPQAPVAAGGSLVDVVKAVSPAVVTITAEGITSTDATTGMTGTGTAKGSGVIFDANGLILTNHHVVAGNPSRLTVTLKDGRTLEATIYGIDTLTDLAIVKVNETGLPTVTIGDSAAVQVGQQAIAIGSPLGEFSDSVTSGIVSALGRSIDVENESLTNLIQTDTAINPGNSGGPLLDASGNVIGINTAVAGNSQGIGFAIPINIARPLLAQASAGQALARPWLGIRFETITPDIKTQAGLPVDNGAWIPTVAALTSDGQGSTGTDPNAQDPNAQDPFGQGQLPQVDTTVIVAGSPAETAGLAEGDIITAVNDQALDALHPLDLVMSSLAPGQTATLKVLRNGQTVDISVTLGTRPASA